MFLIENKQILLEAKRMLKKSKRKDYYKILGVNKSASEEEIKKAYKKRALVHHPGKFYLLMEEQVEVKRLCCANLANKGWLSTLKIGFQNV